MAAMFEHVVSDFVRYELEKKRKKERKIRIEGGMLIKSEGDRKKKVIDE